MKPPPQYTFRIGGHTEDTLLFERIHAVLTLDELLSLPERREAIDQVRRQSGAPTDHFNALYQQLTDDFALFVQNIPHMKGRRIPWLDRQLNIASTIILLREPYILAGELLNRVTDHEKALWNYVMWSGILLSRIGDLISQYHLSLCDEHGDILGDWDPLLGNLPSQGNYYRINAIGSDKPTFPAYHLTLATRLMPPDGLHWIMSNADAFEQWIAMLNGEGDQEHPTLFFFAMTFMKDWLHLHGNTFGKFLDLSTEPDIDVLIELFLNMQEDERWALVHAKQATDFALGEQFLRWLRQGIASRLLEINKAKAAIFITREGALLINPAIFNQFKAEHPMHAQRDVLKAFSQLPMMAQAKLQTYKTQFPGDKPHQVEGVIVKDPKVLFAKNVPPQTEYVVPMQTNSTYRGISQAFQTQTKMKEEVKKAVQADQRAVEKKRESQYPILRHAQEKEDDRLKTKSSFSSTRGKK